MDDVANYFSFLSISTADWPQDNNWTLPGDTLAIFHWTVENKSYYSLAARSSIRFQFHFCASTVKDFWHTTVWCCPASTSILPPSVSLTASFSPSFIHSLSASRYLLFLSTLHVAMSFQVPDCGPQSFRPPPPLWTSTSFLVRDLLSNRWCGTSCECCKCCLDISHTLICTDGKWFGTECTFVQTEMIRILIIKNYRGSNFKPSLWKPGCVIISNLPSNTCSSFLYRPSTFSFCPPYAFALVFRS